MVYVEKDMLELTEDSIKSDVEVVIQLYPPLCYELFFFIRSEIMRYSFMPVGLFFLLKYDFIDRENCCNVYHYARI